jgi:hypothetical protein
MEWSKDDLEMLRGMSAAERRRFFVKALVWGTAGGVAASVFFTYAPRLVAWLFQLVAAHAARIICTTALLCIGVGLYRFRSKYPLLYGLSQVGFACVTGWLALADLSAISQREMLQLIGAVYLIVRGLRDCKEARDKEIESKRTLPNNSMQRNGPERPQGDNSPPVADSR